MLTAIVGVNALGWGIFALEVLPHHLRYKGLGVGLGVAMTAWTLGLRHAFDADHIAAIDNSTRKLMAEGKRPLGSGFFFALGHSSVVMVVGVGITVAAKSVFKAVVTPSSGFATAGGVVGTALSAAFLLAIAALNVLVLVGILRVFRDMRRGAYDEEELEAQLQSRGLMNRFFGRLIRAVDHTWQLFFVGVVFGIGFDTATEVLLLAGTAAAATQGLPWYAVLTLPLLFSGGLMFCDSLDGLFMNVAYGWAFSRPVRKVYYNITITALSVAVAFLVGSIEVVGLLSSKLHLHGWFGDYMANFDLNKAGYMVVGLFVVVWAVALLIWRFGKVEARWALPSKEESGTRDAGLSPMVDQLSSTKTRSGPDRCPGAIALHQAEDGALARVRVPGGRLSSEQVLALAEAARQGNGLLDLTSRANLQIRGLRAEAVVELTELLFAAGLLPSVAHDRARNLIASPTAGRHPCAVAETDWIVDALDAGLCDSPELASLPGRFLFAVDDGSGLALTPAADVTLVAEPGGRFVLQIAGSPTHAPVQAESAAHAALAVARAFLDAREIAGSCAWRIAELDDGPELVARRLGVELLESDVAVAPAPMLAPGRLVQRDGLIALTALVPLGQLDADMLACLAAVAPEVRLSARRTVSVTDVHLDRVEEVAGTLERAGMVLDESSGWAGLSACAGLGRCPKARIDVRAAAARRAAVRPAGAPPEHWTACERRCGQRPEQAIAVTASSAGPRLRVNGQEHAVASTDAALEKLGGGL